MKTKRKKKKGRHTPEMWPTETESQNAKSRDLPRYSKSEHTNPVNVAWCLDPWCYTIHEFVEHELGKQTAYRRLPVYQQHQVLAVIKNAIEYAWDCELIILRAANGRLCVGYYLAGEKPDCRIMPLLLPPEQGAIEVIWRNSNEAD